LVAEDQSLQLVEINEQYADGLFSREEVVAAARPAWEAVGMSLDYSVESRGREDSSEKRAAVTAILARSNGRSAAGYFTDQCWRRGNDQERKRLCHFLRDLFGPLPFCEVHIDPAWLTWRGGLLVSMAQRMYDSRDFTDMPVLADALEEAGCSNVDILRHCREPVDHVRGCWVVDLLLGKT
jgi:hypothetical protein